jgi:ABC-type uncharacterized transport system involved in gliding motility auxiliary subunit
MGRKYLFFIGITLGIAGLVSATISNSWSPLNITLLTLGVFLILLWLLWGLNASRKFWSRRSTQASSNAILSTIAVLVILGLINFLAIRHPVKIDLTETQLFTLSPESQQVVKKLPQPMKLWIFDQDVSQRDRELLANYHRLNPKFTFEVVDPQVKIATVKRFNVKSVGDIYLEYGQKKQLVQTLAELEGISEEKLTNTIQIIQRDRSYHAYFLQGHGEPPLSNAEKGILESVTSLQNKGFKAEPLNLVETGAIPPDAKALIIVSPKRELLTGEIKELEDYLNGGGSLLVTLDPNAKSGLEPLLEKWGIELTRGTIIDPSDEYGLLGYGPTTAIVTNYGNHPITQDFADGISLFEDSQAISTKPIKDIQAVSLLITSPSTWLETNLTSEQVELNPEEDIAGPLDLAVALVRRRKENIESKMVVVGNSNFMTNGWIKQQLNQDFFVNTVSWLIGDEKSILSIRPKEQQNRRINLSPQQASIITVLALIFFPLSALVAAIITWWKRR